MQSISSIFITSVGGVQWGGNYWFATEFNSESANYLYVCSDEAGMSGFPRDHGHSVRLVKDL